MHKVGCALNHSNVDLYSESPNHISPVIYYKEKMYRTVSIMNQIPPHLVKQIGFRDPSQLQSFWNEFVRRWPDTAETIISNIGNQAVWAEKPD